MSTYAEDIKTIIRNAGGFASEARAESLKNSGVIAYDGKMWAACGCPMSARTFKTGCNH